MTETPLRFEGVWLPEAADGGLTLEVAQHRAVSVLGSEASGVDVLADYALALTNPPQGRVLVYGQDIGALSHRAAREFRRRVGYLPADDGLLNNLSLRDNAALPLRFGSDLTDRHIHGRLEMILAQVRLTQAADLRPAEASAEQRRRAALARALAFDPDLVLLEHPFDSLTDRAAAEILELARGGETAAGSRRTVLITGQYVPELLWPRIELRYRLVHGRLEPDE